MMENYNDAHLSRLSDVEVLLSLARPRAIAALHFGGIAVECRLKAMIISYHKIEKWGDRSVRPKDPQKGMEIVRPGHSLLSGLKQMGDLYKKAKADPLFISHLSRIMNPAGSTMIDFIDLRYLGDELDMESVNEWKGSFQYVIGWLKKNEEGSNG